MKTSFLICTLLVSLNLYSQQSEFILFTCKGKIEIIKADPSSKPVPVKESRAKLYMGDHLRLYDHSDAILYHNCGRSVELTNPGVYSVDSLSRVVKSKQETNLLSEYISFFVSEFMKPDEDVEKYSTRHMMVKTNVTRKLEETCNIRLLFPPDSISIADSEINFAWRSAEKDTFTFEIFTNSLLTNNDSILLQHPLADSTFKLKLDSIRFEKDRMYYWAVIHAGDSYCYRYSFSILSEGKLQKVNTEISYIDNLKTVSEDLKLILKAACYEKNALFIEAIRQYLKAKKLAPQQDEYDKLYTEFLARNQLLQFLH